MFLRNDVASRPFVEYINEEELLDVKDDDVERLA